MDWNYIKTRLEFNVKLKDLEIESCGIQNGDLFVKLDSGLRFFGKKSAQKVKKYYLLLPYSVKKRLPFSHYTIAVNIVIRYKGGGLMFGGPLKERNYNVKKGDRIAEMGAYRGFYTLYLSEKVGKHGKIVAIEPQVENYKFLVKNIQANDISNVIPINCAVWDKNQVLTFNRRVGDGQSSSVGLNYSNLEKYEMQGRPLKDILGEAKMREIEFMIIQLNGAEFRALQGLDDIRPINLAIAARYNVDEMNVANEIESFLKSNQYVVERVKEKFLFAERNNTV